MINQVHGEASERWFEPGVVNIPFNFCPDVNHNVLSNPKIFLIGSAMMALGRRL